MEFYNLSPIGELIRLPNPSGIPDDDRPAQRILQIIWVDSDGTGGPGPRYLAYQKRQASEAKALQAEALHP